MSPNKDTWYMFHNAFKSVEIRIFIPEELTGYLQQLTPHFASTLSFVGIFSLTPKGGAGVAGKNTYYVARRVFRKNLPYVAQKKTKFPTHY